MPVTRHFLGWDRPLAELAGEWLLQQAGDRVLNLSEWLVIVPTRNSGRRLREMLANLAHERGKGLFAPLVAPPEYLLSLVSESETANLGTASPDDTLLTWIEVLRGIDSSDYAAVFPVPPEKQDFHWALGTAEGLIDLRRTLGEAGLEISDVPRLLEDTLGEPLRWRELARLERAYLDRLARRNLADLQSTRKQRAQAPPVPPGVQRIAIIGTPDPLPLALRILECLASRIPTTSVIHAPDGLKDDFDAWGRPKADAWNRHLLDFPSFDSAVHLLPDVLAQAEIAADRITAYESPANTVAVAVLDEEIIPALEQRLHNAKLPVFSPDGESLKSHGIVHLLRCLRDLLRKPTFQAFLELLRCPDYSAWLGQHNLFWNPISGLRDLDRLHQEHLPADLKALRRLWNTPELEKTEELLRQLRKGADLIVALHEIVSARNPAGDSDSAQAFRAAAERLAPLLDSVSASGTKLGADDCLTLALRAVESVTLYDDRNPEAIVLSGWLEQGWEDAPHLLLTGFNDGLVPDAIVGHPFLPESLRRQLAERTDFSTNERRQARDVYLLAALLAPRRERGRVEIFLSKLGQDGDPMRPSRLLFRCTEKELPARAQKLFGEVRQKGMNLPWTPGFLLTPRPSREIESISVTSFASYLRSPFHFYLQRVEKMRAVDAGKQELDAMDFGNLIHNALRAFADDSTIRDSADERAISEFLVAEVDRLALENWGPSPSLPVRIQLHAACQRLEAAARVQAEDRLKGWRIERTEFDLGEGAWTIGGLTINGRVDRIDRHEDGRIRVLDYKTSDSPNSPTQAHLANVKDTDEHPDYAILDIKGKTKRWTDLQLPLYRLGLAATFGPDIECGYFLIPKAVTETKIDVWDDLNATLDEAAMRCAEGVISGVLEARFWPCQIDGFHEDEFEALHLGVPEQTINPTHLQSVPSR